MANRVVGCGEAEEAATWRAGGRVAGGKGAVEVELGWDVQGNYTGVEWRGVGADLLLKRSQCH